MTNTNLRKTLLTTESANIELSQIIDKDIELIYETNLGITNKNHSDYLSREIDQFSNVLFDKSETIAICKSLYENNFVNQSDLSENLARYISINPTSSETSTRKNDDVTVFRNFLIEFDDIPIHRQLELMKSINFPFSTVTFSGNKSLHFILSLETPLEDLQTYQLVSRWLHNIVNKHVGSADPATRPPSFTTRFPNVINENGIYSQKLLIINERISDEVFFNWLETFVSLKPSFSTTSSFKDKIKSALLNFINNHQQENLATSEWFDCPLCIKEGKTSNTKKMKVNPKTFSIKCCCSKDHDKKIVKELFKIQRNDGGTNE